MLKCPNAVRTKHPNASEFAYFVSYILGRHFEAGVYKCSRCQSPGSNPVVNILLYDKIEQIHNKSK